MNTLPFNSLTQDIWPAGFSEQEMQSLGIYTEIRHFDDGSCVFRNTDPIHRIYYLQIGSLKLDDEKDNRTETSSSLESGHFFGLMHYLTGHDSGERLLASGEVTLLVINPDRFFELWTSSARRCYQLLQCLVEYYYGILTSEARLQQSEQGNMIRLAGWLDRLHERIVESEDHKITITLSELQQMAGLENLSRSELRSIREAATSKLHINGRAAR